MIVLLQMWPSLIRLANSRAPGLPGCQRPECRARPCRGMLTGTVKLLLDPKLDLNSKVDRQMARSWRSGTIKLASVMGLDGPAGPARRALRRLVTEFSCQRETESK